MTQDTSGVAFLIAAAQRVLDGGDLTSEQMDQAPPPRDLPSGDARKLCYALHYWSEDHDIRAKDRRYEQSRRDQLAELLARVAG